MSVFNLYKPLRNRICQFPLLESLQVIHAVSQNSQFKQPMPNWIARPPHPLGEATRPHPWELELLAKEFVLNANTRGQRSLARWSDFSILFNQLRKLEDDIYGQNPGAQEDILHEIFRIAHREFPWQTPPNSNSLARYFRIYSSPEISRIVAAQFGIDIRTIYLVGFALITYFMSGAIVDWNSLSVPTVSQDQLDTFVRHFSKELTPLRQQIKDTQSFTTDFVYVFNPLRRWPILFHDFGEGPKLVAPVPTLLFRAFTDGIYYEVVNVPGFANSFGESFQQYVGDALHSVIPRDWHLISEQPYTVGRDEKRTIDWILVDPTANLFVECKTKRMRLAARTQLRVGDILSEDIDKLADAVVQSYKGIADALEGRYPNWRPNGLPIYPVIATLEEWYLVGPHIIDELERRISEKLSDAGVDNAFIAQHPYSILGMDDFEFAIQLIARVGIEAFMKPKCERSRWNLRGFALDNFRHEVPNIKRTLFPEVLADISNQLIGGGLTRVTR